MSEVRPMGDNGKLSGPPSPAQDALEVESALRDEMSEVTKNPATPNPVATKKLTEAYGPVAASLSQEPTVAVAAHTAAAEMVSQPLHDSTAPPAAEVSPQPEAVPPVAAVSSEPEGAPLAAELSPDPEAARPAVKVSPEPEAASPVANISSGPEAVPSAAEVSPKPEAAPLAAKVSPKLEATPPAAEVSPKPEAAPPAAKVSPKPEAAPLAAKVSPKLEARPPAAEVSPKPEAAPPAAKVSPKPEAAPPAAEVSPKPEAAPPATDISPKAEAAPPAEGVSPDLTAEKVSPVPTPAPNGGGDDSGCEVEPEPSAMSERAGPDMADVEQLARSVVSDTLLRAKQDAKLQAELEHRASDPDADADGWLDIVGNGQLKKKVITAGTGDRESRPKRSEVVTVRLSGRLEDGTPVQCGPDRLTFGLGDGEVVTGLDMAVGLMQPGEKADVYMDSRFAYGEKGLEDSIAPNASIIFTVSLEQVQPAPKYEEMSAQERLKIGSEKRDRGNWWFKRDDYNHAIQCYRRALDFFDNESDEFTGLPDDVHVLFEERLKVHNNLAAAQMKLEAHDAALRSLQLVLNCQPDNVKALYRKGKVLAAQGQLPEAAEALRLALEHSPDNRTVQAELARLTARQRKVAEEQKSLYRKMLGLPAVEPKPAAPSKSVTTRLLVLGVACGLVAIALSRLKVF